MTVAAPSASAGSTALAAVRGEWGEQAIRVSLARAQRWRDEACLARAAHVVALSCPDAREDQPHVRRHLAQLRAAQSELRAELGNLGSSPLPSDLLVQLDSVELSREDLDAYLAKYPEPGQG